MTYGRDVIVEREGARLGTILGIILAASVVLALVWFFFLGGIKTGNNPGPNNGDTNITMEQPQPPPVN